MASLTSAFVAGVLILKAGFCNSLDVSNISGKRRSFIKAIAASTTAGFLVSEAKADPYDAFLPAGSRVIMEPYSDVVDGWSLPSQLPTQLASSRILATSLSPLQQNNPFASQELYYPSFLFGSWDVVTTLRQKVYPYGTSFVPAKSLVEGSPRNRNEKIGDSASFQMHFFSTLADTAANQITVNLGLGVPETKIIADRAFNAISMSRGYNQLTPVEDVEWDYRADPTRLTLRFGATPLAEDMRPLGQRRGEVYITARQSEINEDGSVYCGAERSRSVTLGPGVVVTTDQETITEYRKVDEDSVEALSRIAVYLTPNPNSREGVLWQQVGGKAVAFFDYTWQMTRLREEFTLSDGSKVRRPCVRTPKDIIQCE